MSIRKIQILESCPKELALLKNRVKNSGHRATLLVHPNFHLTPYSNPSPEYLQQQADILMAGVLGQLPLVIFEDYSLPIDNLFPEDEDGSVFVVKTERGGSTPISRLRPNTKLDPAPEVYRRNPDHLYRLAFWGQLYQCFREVEISEVIMAGQLLDLTRIDTISSSEFTSDWQYVGKEQEEWVQNDLEVYWIRRYYPEGCVGHAARRLLDGGFRVSFSNITWPDRLIND